jgi:outer membrane protein assembly factor BamB
MSKQRMVSILVLVCAARTVRASDWTELGGDSQQSRDSAEVSGPAFTPTWTYALDSGQIIATPVTSGGAIVVAGSNGAVAALDATKGTALWTRTLPDGGVRATPMISNEQVTVSTLGGTLYSLKLGDGAIAWQRAFGGQNYSSPLFVPRAAPGDRDTFVIGAGFPQQDIWRFDALTGEPVWQTASGAIAALVYSTPAVVGNRLVVGMNGGRFQSLDLATGAADWKLDAGGQVYLSSPLVVGGTVYMFPGDSGANLFAVDGSTGAPAPGFPVAIPDLAPVAGGTMYGRGPAVSSPTSIGGLIIAQIRRNDMVTSGRSFTVSMRESVVAIDPVSAQVRWQYAVANLVAPNSNGVPELNACPTPVGFSGGATDGAYVIVSSSITGRVAVLDARTGQERWTAPLSSAGRSSPVFSNGQLLIATDDGILHAFSSTSNHAPTAPTQVGPSGEQAFSSAGMTLDWQGATDDEGGALSYVVRIEEEGAVDTRVESQVGPGQAQMNVSLKADTSYLFAVRSRDAEGALSAWSAPQHLHVGDDLPAPIVVPAETMPPAVMATPMVPSPAPGADAPPSSGDVTATPPTSGDPMPAPAASPAPATPVSVAAAPAPAAMATDAQAEAATPATTDANDAAGCSVARGRGANLTSLLALGMLTLVARGRARRATASGRTRKAA